MVRVWQCGPPNPQYQPSRSKSSNRCKNNSIAKNPIVSTPFFEQTGEIRERAPMPLSVCVAMYCLRHLYCASRWRLGNLSSSNARRKWYRSCNHDEHSAIDEPAQWERKVLRKKYVRDYTQLVREERSLTREYFLLPGIQQVWVFPSEVCSLVDMRKKKQVFTALDAG